MRVGTTGESEEDPISGPIEKAKWLCFGAGAIGTYVGGSLALSGDGVVFVERPNAIEDLRKRGLRLDLRADKRRKWARPYDVPSRSIVFCGSLEDALEHGPFDAAIYALKSFDTPEAIEAMRPHATRLPAVVCFSNGVENEAALGRALGAENVVAATVTTSVGRRGIGDVVLERLRGIGVAASHPACPKLITSSVRAFLNPRRYRNAEAMKWSKMLTNLIANPTSAILDMTPTEILRHPDLYRLEIGMMRECLAVMAKRRTPVVDLPGTPVRALALAVQLPPWVSQPLLARAAGGGRGGKMPSFHIDLQSRRGRSEVEYLHGAVVRAGKAAGVATPINAFLTDTLMALTRGELAIDAYAGKPGRLLSDLQARAASSVTSASGG